MTALGLISAKGSVGVTTSAVLLAALWPTPSVLVEADPAGGDLRYWFSDESGQPLRADRGVVSLLTARGLGDGVGGAGGGAAGAGLARHTQVLAGGLPVLIGPDGPGQVVATEGLWDRLAASIAGHEGHIVLDSGRLVNPGTLAHTVPLMRGCQLTLVVCRATVPSLAHAHELLRLLASLELPTELLLIGAPPDRQEAAAALNLSAERVHLLPHDPPAAASLTGAWTRRLDHSALVKAGRAVAGELYRRVEMAAAQASENDTAQSRAYLLARGDGS